MSENEEEPKSEEDEERKKKLDELLSQNTWDPIEGDKFKCPFCTEIFKTIGSIIDHIHHEHDGRKMECDEEDCRFRCELQFQMYKHKIKCHSKNSVKTMLCPFCRDFSGYGMALVGHCNETHKDQEKNCPHEGCDITYFFDYQIARHLKNAHKTYKRIVTRRLDGRTGLLHQCLKCNKIFKTRGQLGKHQFEEYGIPMPVNKKDPHLKETTLCPQCGKSMKVSSLKIHIELVHSKFAAGCFICDICGNNYSTKISITNHIKYAHMERKPIKCRHCDQMFPNVGSRRYHEIKTHTEFKHVCSICGLRCFNPTNLRDHFATHTGEANFQCAICEKKFKRRYILKNHMYIHTDNRPFKCSICESTFKTKNYLNSHMKVHEK
ncbi:zinc finger protein 816-like [Culicoides brevitarsis]|uniref:zinc finger protein 816-like n=1 Tax=Culicoides brevitarsis TaxID=469753 RepID=UPI00307C28AA